MIKLINNKFSLSTSEYTIIKDLYGAFRLDPYTVTLFCYGIENGDLMIDESIYIEATNKNIAIRDMFYEIIKTITTTTNYIIEN